MSSAPIVIRPASMEDLPACGELSVLHNGGDPATWAAKYATELKATDAVMVIAALDDQVVGYGRAGFHEPITAPTGYYLGGLVIRPDKRRQGIASKLTRARMEWVRDHAPEVWYFTNIQNLASRELHRELGFVEVTTEFAFPGVTFAGGVGVLARALL